MINKMTRHEFYTIESANGDILWQAQDGPQQKLFDLTFDPNVQADEILIGGARGVGKTAAAIAWIVAHIDNPKFKGLVLRKTNESLKEFIDEAWALFRKLGAKKTDRPTGFVFPSGAKIYTGHFKDERSLEDYKGHEYHLIVLEEATQISMESLYEKLLGSNRSTVRGITPRILLTTNPDGPGNAWIQGRWIKVNDENGNRIPPGTPFRTKSGRIRVFIPGTVHDNKILCDINPGYVTWLQNIENEALRRAWYLGDWDCQDGAFFPEFRPVGPRAGEPERANHVIPAFEIPAWCHRWAALDWGYAHHAAGYWGAYGTDRRTHVYREMVVRNFGAEELGMEFARRTMIDLEGMPDRSMVLYLSHDAFSGRNSGKSIAEQIRVGIEAIIGPGSCYLLGKTEEERKLEQNDKDGARESFEERFTEQYKNSKIVIKRSSQDRVAAASVVRDYLKWRVAVDKVEPDMAYANSLLGMVNGYQRFTTYMTKFKNQQDRPPVPRVQIHDCCKLLIDTIPQLRPDPNNLEKVRKFHGDADREKVGDDPWDGFSYLIMGASEQVNALPYSEFMAKEVMRHLRPGTDDINLKIQVAMQAHQKFNKQSQGIVIDTFPRDCMGARWQN